MPNNQPIAVEVIAGKRYLWCSCGESKKQPWCDGSHAGTEFSPLLYEASETKTLHVCACKKTGHPPLCDGTHQLLFGGGRDEYFTTDQSD
ncbi:MAG: CDGSH iron-sulfur domain-containing protein [Bermanella sp.]